MERTRRFLEKHLPRIDLVLEVTDARIPETARWSGLSRMLGKTPLLLVLNKADLADSASTQRWIEHYSLRGLNACALALVADDASGRSRGSGARRDFRSAVERLAAAARASGGRAAKVAVVGLPNVGKSSVLNAVAGRRRMPTGAKPGLTRGQQWAVASAGLWLLDLPGVLPPVARDDDAAARLALIGTLPDGAYDPVETAFYLLDAMVGRLGAAGACEALGLPADSADGTGPAALLGAFGLKRGLIGTGGEVDPLRGSQALLALFRRGGLGRITLEEAPDCAEV
jgi:ribosome biogenesis GTPase A